jgi:uncharacterized membrane protein
VHVDFDRVIERVGKGTDALGVAVMVLGLVIALATFAIRAWHRDTPAEVVYKAVRRSIGRSILLGLELLVAADIIRTVAASPSFRSVGVLAAIVAIRSFLSFTLEMEVSGRWPWQHDDDEARTGSRRWSG